MLYVISLQAGANTINKINHPSHYRYTNYSWDRIYSTRGTKIQECTTHVKRATFKKWIRDNDRGAPCRYSLTNIIFFVPLCYIAIRLRERPIAGQELTLKKTVNGQRATGARQFLHERHLYAIRRRTNATQLSSTRTTLSPTDRWTGHEGVDRQRDVARVGVLTPRFPHTHVRLVRKRSKMISSLRSGQTTNRLLGLNYVQRVLIVRRFGVFTMRTNWLLL